MLSKKLGAVVFGSLLTVLGAHADVAAWGTTSAEVIEEYYVGNNPWIEVLDVMVRFDTQGKFWANPAGCDNSATNKNIAILERDTDNYEMILANTMLSKTTNEPVFLSIDKSVCAIDISWGQPIEFPKIIGIVMPNN